MNSRQRRKSEAERHNQELIDHKAWIRKRALEPRRKRGHDSKTAMIMALALVNN